MSEAQTLVSEVQKLADRYVAVWNETDPAARRKTIVELWAPDGQHYMGTIEARGHEALEKRVSSSHEKNVKVGGNRFRPVGRAQALRNVVTFNWEMVSGSGEVASAGVGFLLLDDRGRISFDYLFALA
jgi:hypothetical protein